MARPKPLGKLGAGARKLRTQTRAEATKDAENATEADGRLKAPWSELSRELKAWRDEGKVMSHKTIILCFELSFQVSVVQSKLHIRGSSLCSLPADAHQPYGCMYLVGIARSGIVFDFSKASYFNTCTKVEMRFRTMLHQESGLVRWFTE